ncbi:hypothetical protein [Gemmata sp.]|uniref:hypothetical protein n=1 Tax=Gemmata sp. TaxID=1914242 RepID=UPI003F72C489
MSDDVATTDDPTPEVHAPGRNGHADTRPEATTADVLALIAAGKPVENVRVRRLKLRGEFATAVTFKNCTLVQPEFGAATFKGDLSFVWCTLDRPLFAKPVTVEGNFGLNGSTVSKSRFAQLTVHGKAFFSGAEFRGKALFEKCEFRQKVSWWEARLECWGEFKACGFLQEADFRSVHADQGLIFAGCTFAGDFLIRGATVCKKLQLDGCRFERLLDVSKAKLNDFAYLEAIEQGPEMRFAFGNAVAERLLVRPEQVEGRLASELAGQHEQAMHEYGLLKKCYQGQHRFNAEDWAFYRFKVNQRLSTRATWDRPWTKVRRFCDWLFLDVGCGYGTNPARAVRMAVVIILGFALLYGLGVEEFHAEKKPFPDAEVTDPINRVMIGLITSVSVFTSGMGGIREIAKGWMNVPVMVESVLGTLLFGLFIVAFSRKVIR